MVEEAQKLLYEPALPDRKYFKIGEAALFLGVKPHVLRYWETEFTQIRPYKSRSGQRLYRKKDVEALAFIQRLLYEEKFTIAGAKQVLHLQQMDTETEELGEAIIEDEILEEMLGEDKSSHPPIEAIKESNLPPVAPAFLVEEKAPLALFAVYDDLNYARTELLEVLSALEQ